MPSEVPQHAGLCALCRHARSVPTPRSMFLLCERSVKDATFERYPRLPIRTCRGFEGTGAASSDSSTDDDQGHPQN